MYKEGCVRELTLPEVATYARKFRGILQVNDNCLWKGQMLQVSI